MRGSWSTAAPREASPGVGSARLRQTVAVTNAGWYPDPSGQPQTYRYWNGQSWSEQTTNNPASPPPGAPPGYPAYGQPAPPAAPAAPPGQAVPPSYGVLTPPPGGQGYGGYGPQGYGAAPAGYPGSAAPPPGGGTGKTVALVTLAVVLVLAIGVGAFFVVRSLGEDDTSAGGDDSSESADPDATEDPTDDPSDSPTDEETDSGTVQPTNEQCEGGKPHPGRLPASSATLTGGGLTIPSLVDEGYLPDADSATPFTWADDYQLSYKVIPDAGNSWVANYGVGGMAKRNGIETTEQAAEIVLACMTASPLYEGFTDTTDLEVGPVTVDGHEAYSILTEVRVDNPDVTVEGDVAHVVVVDTGDPDSFGLYISVVPIGDQASIDQQAEVFEQIQVD